MVTDTTRNAVWQELLDVARLVRYYEAMADRHRRNHLVVRFVLVATAMGGLVAFFDLLPVGVRLLLGAGIAGVVAWDLLSRYASKAAVLHAVSMECGLLEIELRDVWLRLETMADDEARREWLRVSRRLAEVTGWAGQAGVGEDGELKPVDDGEVRRTGGKPARPVTKTEPPPPPKRPSPVPPPEEKRKQAT